LPRLEPRREPEKLATVLFGKAFKILHEETIHLIWFFFLFQETNGCIIKVPFRCTRNIEEDNIVKLQKMKVPESVQRSATDNFGLTTSLVNAVYLSKTSFFCKLSLDI